MDNNQDEDTSEDVNIHKNNPEEEGEDLVSDIFKDCYPGENKHRFTGTANN